MGRYLSSSLRILVAQRRLRAEEPGSSLRLVKSRGIGVSRCRSLAPPSCGESGRPRVPFLRTPGSVVGVEFRIVCVRVPEGRGLSVAGGAR
jgi:hypothetical protein